MKAVYHPKEDNISLLIGGIEDRLRIGGTKAIAITYVPFRRWSPTTSEQQLDRLDREECVSYDFAALVENVENGEWSTVEKQSVLLECDGCGPGCDGCGPQNVT